MNERRRHGDHPFDITPIRDTSVDDLNRSLFEQDYLPNAVAPEFLEANERTYTERLAASEMIASAQDDRNPNFAESMRVLGLVQRFGVGVPLARKLLRDAGHPPPEFIVAPAQVEVTVRSVVDAESGL